MKINDVYAWIRYYIELPKYASLFYKKNISGMVLIKVKEHFLIKIGVDEKDINFILSKIRRRVSKSPYLNTEPRLTEGSKVRILISLEKIVESYDVTNNLLYKDLIRQLTLKCPSFKNKYSLYYIDNQFDRMSINNKADIDDCVRDSISQDKTTKFYIVPLSTSGKSKSLSEL